MAPRVAVALVILTVSVAVADGAPASARRVGEFAPAPCPVALPEGLHLGPDVDFGFVTVPERHADPNGRVIEVAVARFRSPAEKPAPDPLILNTGGPGDSNLDQFLPLLASEEGRPLLAQRDVVIIELRGLRYSRPALVCDEVFDAQRSMLAKDIKGEPANGVLLAAMRACHQRLTKAGVDPSAFNNMETAADIAMVMTALGYDRFNLFGSSAGTLIAQHVMRDFPQRVRSVVLNAAVPLGQSLLKNMLPNTATSLRETFRRCAADEACNRAYPDLEQRFFSLLAQLNEQPVTLLVANPGGDGKVDLVLNGDRLASWLFASMYGNTQLPASLGKLLAGDFSEVQEAPGIFFPLTRFAYGLSYSIFSAESMDYTAQDVTADGQYAAFADGISLFFGPKLLAQAQTFWTVKPLDRRLLQPLKSAIPTLILNGELDHVLPPQYAQDMVRHLSQGHLYIFPGVAHSPVDAGDCALSMMMQFFADPSRAPDASCVKQFKHEFKTGS